MVWVTSAVLMVLGSSVGHFEGVSAQVLNSENAQFNLGLEKANIVDRSAQLLDSSLLFGVLSEFVSLENGNSRCNNEVQIILDGIRMRKVWALKSINQFDVNRDLNIYSECILF